MIAWIVLAVVALVAFVLYPKLMLRTVGALLSGIANVLLDCVGLLFAWI